MRTKLNSLHIVAGIVTVLVFIATGLLMRFHYTRIYEANHLVRMMFRSIHIYILLAGLLNIAVGAYLQMSGEKRKHAAQVFGSICILVAPVVLVAAFFYEPARETLERYVTELGIILLLVGTLLHLVGAAHRRAT